MARAPITYEPRQGDPRNNRNAIVDRSQFERELFDAQGRPTPTLYAFAGRMQKEVGAQGPEAQMAWAETVFNRAAARRHTLDYELRNHGNYNYWPAHQPTPGSSRDPRFVDMITKVMRCGTNLSLGATGNASESVGVGRETFRSRGERFGVETGDTRWWNNSFGSLIRGVGRFIGDVAGAIGQGIAAVANGVVQAGAWVFNGVRSAFTPQQTERPHMHAQQHMPPRTAQYQQGPYQPNQYQVRQPERVARMDTPPSTAWVINGVTNVPHRDKEQPADQRPDPRPRP